MAECCKSKKKMKDTPYKEKKANDVCLFTSCKRTIQGPMLSSGDHPFGDINVLTIALGWDIAASGKTHWSYPQLFFYLQVFPFLQLIRKW